MPSSTGMSRVRRAASAGILAVATTAAALTFFGGQAAGQGEFFVLPHATLDPATTSTRETIVLDVRGSERAGLKVEDLVAKFRRIRGQEIDDDSLLIE